ncbi:MAG: hypothetical protein EBU57_05310 [Alphaproteobacteria bacterium]|nr:hypothetical protein [Alphaproteobacteria bacterium]
MKRLIFGMMFAVLAYPAHAGNLSAYACGEFAAGKPLDVQADNDSAQMEKIRTTVINALRDRKTSVSYMGSRHPDGSDPRRSTPERTRSRDGPRRIERERQRADECLVEP